MNYRLARTWLCTVAIVVLGTVARAEPESKDAPKPLPSEIAKAWGDAGAEVGWMKVHSPPKSYGFQFWNPWREEGEAGVIPAFRFPDDMADGVLVTLPDPEVAFGLDFHCGYYADVTLKELAKLKNLQSLNIGAGNQGTAFADLTDLAGMTNLRGLYLFHLRVTDEQAKHLVGLKNLQVLDLSYTPLTDVGLKELAGLRNLRWLNLRYTRVTPAGVAALRKHLTECKVVTGDD